jgi:hypothetical protein
MISGWKTKAGLIAVALGGALIAGAKVAPSPELAIWLEFGGTIIFTLGGGLAGYGVADKVERKSGIKADVEPN